MSLRYLIRARLRRDASVQTLAPLLLPANPAARAMAAHRLVWSLFANDAEAKRDFLWREHEGGFLILAHRPPSGGAGIFTVDCKPFEPALREGDRLRFLLRANPTKAVKAEGATRGKRADVVMAALHAVPREGRAAQRPALIATEALAWLRRQGDRHGFSVLDGCIADGYARLRISREAGRPIEVATIDFAGTLRVENPELLLPALGAGFGRARAFGCGLMLVRRA